MDKNFKNPNLSIISVICVYLFLFFRVLFYSSIYHDSYSFFKSEDIYWILNMGNWIIHNAQIPHFNFIGINYSELNHLPWVCYQWMFALIMAFTNKLLGFYGLIFIYSVFYLAAISLLAYGLYLRGFRIFPEIAISVAIASNILMSILDLRSFIFTVIGGSFLFIIFPYLERKRFLWISLPVLFLLWTNLHLGFIFGIIWLAVEMIIIAVRKKSLYPIALLLLCILMTGINPNGFYLYKYLYVLGNSPFMNTHIMELLPFSFSHNYVADFYIILLLTSFIYAFNSVKIRGSEKIMFIFSIILTFISARHISFLIIFMPLFYSAAFEKFINSFFKESEFFQNQYKQKIKLHVYFAICVFTGLILCLNKAYPLPETPKFLTPSFIEYLNKNHLKSPVLSRAEVGGELLYYTSARSFLDTRFDMYGDKYVKKYVELYSLTGDGIGALKKNNIKYVLYNNKIPYGGKEPVFGLIEKKFKEAGCKLLYKDKELLLFKIGK